MHGRTGDAEAIPTLPCTVKVTTNSEGGMEAEQVPRSAQGDEQAAPPTAPSGSDEDTWCFTFTGAPCQMLPLLRQMVRFERPFITWDI